MNLDFLIEWALCPGEGVSRHEPTPKAFLDLEDILNHVTSRLENYVGRRPNIPQVTVAGPPTQNLDNVVRDTCQGDGSSCTNPKAVARIIPWDTGSLENRTEPSIHYGGGKEVYHWRI